MFVDEFFDTGYYQELPLEKRNQLKFGRVCWTHAYYPHENLQFFRPVQDSTEPTRTIASKFQIESAGADAFHRKLPLAVPRLETNEEFLVVRAKKRPVIIVQPELPISPTINRGFGGRVHRNLCTVAQVFGLADVATRRAEFSPAFVERVRQMEYPQLLFLPERAGLFEVDSLLRLDELQSVFVPHLEPTKFALATEVESLLIEQVEFLFTQRGPNSYTELRQLILGS